LRYVQNLRSFNLQAISVQPLFIRLQAEPLNFMPVWLQCQEAINCEHQISRSKMLISSRNAFCWFSSLGGNIKGIARLLGLLQQAKLAASVTSV
jgi:hypothetical protein